MKLAPVIKQAVTWIHERSNRGQALRFFLFLTIYSLGRYLELLFDTTSFSKELLYTLHERLSFFITHSSCFILQGFYPDIHVTINHTIFIEGEAHIQMLPGCTGLQPMLRLTFVLLFYPLAWRRKIVLWPLSMVILIFASTLHFMMLIPIAYHFSEWFSFAHDWLTKIIFYGFYFLCWLIWEKSYKASPNPHIKGV